LRIGSEVTRWFRRENAPQVIEVTPERVLFILGRAGVSFVLMGTHALNGYRDEARATQDVDVLVTRKDFRKAVRVLEEKFPYLEVLEQPAVTRFIDPVSQKAVIDVMKPAARGLQVVFRHTVQVAESHRIPTLEMALVSKFLAMNAPNRRADKRLLDLGDFVNVVLNQREVLDVKKLTRLADSVQPRGGAKIRRLLADIEAGRKIQL
jgi:hypothetical protein